MKVIFYLYSDFKIVEIGKPLFLIGVPLGKIRKI